MLTLALDTTTRAGSVAVTDEDRVLAVHAGNSTRTHGERLPGEIDRVLVSAAVERSAIDLLVVASGPGAFTGLRIGLAAMQGLALTLGRPIIGVSALDALAWSAVRMSAGDRPAPLEGVPYTITAWMDAQRGEVFSAVYPASPVGLRRTGPPSPEGLLRTGPQTGHPESRDVLEWFTGVEPAVGSPEAILANAAFDRATPIVFVGDGARRYADAIAAASTQWSVSSQELLLAPALAWIGRRLAAMGHATTPHALQPLYVRRPDAEIERAEREGEPVRRSAEREGES